MEAKARAAIDRFVHARWLFAVSIGARTPLPVDDALMELINDASLQQWGAIPPRTAVQDCLAAAAGDRCLDTVARTRRRVGGCAGAARALGGSLAPPS